MLANRVARKTFDYVQQLIGAYPTAYPNYNVVVACLPVLGVTAAVLALDTVFAKSRREVEDRMARFPAQLRGKGVYCTSHAIAPRTLVSCLCLPVFLYLISLSRFPSFILIFFLSPVFLFLKVLLRSRDSASSFVSSYPRALLL